MTPPPTNNQFVPLVATMPSAERREFQITVISEMDQPQAFQSLEKAAPGTADKMPSKKNCEPSVSLQRENGRVTGIRIQCSCGQTIDLSCVYEAAAPTKTSGPAAAAKPDQPPKPEKPAKLKK